MDELSGRGSHRPSKGADEREKRWLQKERGRKGASRKGSCRRRGAEKVAVAEIVGKTNSGNRGGFLTGRVVGQTMLADR